MGSIDLTTYDTFYRLTSSQKGCGGQYGLCHTDSTKHHWTVHRPSGWIAGSACESYRGTLPIAFCSWLAQPSLLQSPGPPG